MTTAAARPSAGSLRRVGWWCGVVAGIVLLVAAGTFRLGGGRWLTVLTPSMGTAAPVGTLVLVRPTTVAQLHVGDIIAFHPPTEPQHTFTHRIIRIDGGQIATRGDINGAADPWTVTDRDLVGKVFFRGWGLGWLVRCLPIILLGLVITWSLTRWAPVTVRRPALLLATSLLILLSTSLFKPFVGTEQLTATTENGLTHVSMVSTGILPIRVYAKAGHAAPLDLRSGQAGVVTLTQPPPNGHYELAAGLHMPTSWWAVVIAVWLTPMLVGMARRAPAPVPVFV